MSKGKTYTPEEILGGEKVFEYLKVKDKYYEFTAKDGKTVMREVDKKKVNKQLALAKKLAERLKDALNAKAVLTEIFMTRYDMKSLEKLQKLVEHPKRKYKARTREGYCVDIKIGNHIIPLVD